MLDPTRWFIVIPDMSSNGLSSGAADTADYPAVVTMAFLTSQVRAWLD